MVHDWSIAEREYERKTARRGRRHAYEQLEPATTALVVVDMVRFFTRESARCQAIIPMINSLASALRAAGGVVAWVRPSADDPHPDWSREFFGEATAELFRTSGGEGPLHGRIDDGLAWTDADLFVEKRSRSAFFPGYCALPEMLAERGVGTVIVVGTVTNVCCESSVRDAATLGYRVIMAADANATNSDATHNATLHTVYRTFGDVRTTDEILALIAAGVAKPSTPGERR
jgi:nicotinamidase-related amidase